MTLFLRLAAMLWLLLAGSAHAAIAIGDGQVSAPAGQALQYLRDDTHRLSLADVRGLPASAWDRNQADIFNQGYSSATWWLRVEVRNDRADSDRQLLEIAYPVLDDLEVWVFDGARLDSHFPLGERLPFATRPLRHRNFLIPLHLAPGATETVLMRVRSTSAIQLPVTLWQADAHGAQDQSRLIWHGVYFGTLAVMAIYNLFVFLVLRDRTYLYYVLCVLSMGTFLGSLNGLAFQYLWPTATTWTNQALNVLLSSVVLFGAFFATRLLRLREHLPLLHHGMLGLAVLAGLIITATLVTPEANFIRTVIVVAFISCLVLLVAGVLRWRQGDSTARLYTFAWSAWLFGGILLALNKFGLLPQNAFTENAVQFGSAIEVILLSFALAERINVERQLRFEAQHLALATQRQANETLELRVQERTEALEDANRQLAELSTTDALTGLRNRRHLDERLREEFTRCHRHRHSLAVLLLDIDHFKRFNDTHGHAVGDDCLRQVAIALRDCLRDTTDHFARYGGEEFCVLLPETDAEGARIVAERVRQAVATLPFEVNGRRVPVTVSVGVAAQVPERIDGEAALVAAADAALYLSKGEGRNCVTVAGAAASV
ncbi:MAG: hypothetical protein K0S46_1767 [Moraxellaceae bacterium]|jgi:diguanylate cyclase|nr:hypothetical protein [Moraxellaceae bacterium]